MKLKSDAKSEEKLTSSLENEEFDRFLPEDSNVSKLGL